MEKPQYRNIPTIYSVVIILGIAAFSCSLAAEFKKSKAKDMKIDGSLCYVPRSIAFGLGIASLTFLTIAQIAGTTVAAIKLWSRENKITQSRVLPIALLVLSWISFGLVAILLGTGSSMNDKQPYGKGWLNGECYFVKDGVYVGSTVLVVVTVVSIIGFVCMTKTTEEMYRRYSPDEERNPATKVTT